MSPVSLDDLRKGKVSVLPDETSHPGRVLALLRKRPDQAWRAQEIAERLDADAHTIGATLRRLRARGLIDKDGVHWFAVSEEEGAHLRMAQLLTRATNRRLGPEDPADWRHLPHE